MPVSHKKILCYKAGMWLVVKLYAVLVSSNVPADFLFSDNTGWQWNVPISEQRQVRMGNGVPNLLCWCHVKPLALGAWDAGIPLPLAHCFGPKKRVGWLPSFFLQRCHRLILQTFFHLHNRMSSDSLLSYYLHLRILCGKAIPAAQRGPVRNTEQWEFGIFFSFCLQKRSKATILLHLCIS